MTFIRRENATDRDEQFQAAEKQSESQGLLGQYMAGQGYAIGADGAIQTSVDDQLQAMLDG